MDPLTLAVVRGSLEQIADEMDLHLIHAAISPIISETNDCANGIFHPVTGETIAQGRYGLPVFLAYMQFAVQKVIELANADGGLKPGDMWIMNDTYLGGSHLQDVQLVAPVFVQGELFAVMATTGHWMDIGGNVPGGWGPRATEIHQEGIVIPPVKLYEEGRLNKALVAMFRANVRLPDDIAGDLAAMSNVFSVGSRGIEALVKRYGRDTLTDCLNEMIAYSERQMRSYISELPDGTYTFKDAIDNDGLDARPLPVKLKVTISGDHMHFDFSGSALTAQERHRIRRDICPQFLEYYSSTEGGGVSTLSPDDQLRYEESVGRPALSVEVQIVDNEDRLLPHNRVGRIRYRGPAVAQGFHADPEASTEAFKDGWFYPGDRGWLDAEGFLYLEGRNDDVVNAAGNKFNLLTLDLWLQDTALFDDVASFTYETPSGSRVGLAFVSANPPEPHILVQRIQSFLPNLQIGQLLRLSALPRNKMDKVVRIELQKLAKENNV